MITEEEKNAMVRKKIQKDGIAQATDRPASIKSSRILIHKTVVCKPQEMLILKILNKTLPFQHQWKYPITAFKLVQQMPYVAFQIVQQRHK